MFCISTWRVDPCHVQKRALRRHSGGQAYVSVRDKTGRRREILLGPYDSPESQVESKRVLALLKAYHGYYPFADVEEPKNPEGLTVDQIILAWWRPRNAWGLKARS